LIRHASIIDLMREPRRNAARLLLVSITLTCCGAPAHGADPDEDDADPAATSGPAVYLDLRTSVARLPAGSLPIGFGNSALATALRSIAGSGGTSTLPINRALALPVRSVLSVALPLTIDPSDSVSLYGGLSGSTTNGTDLSSLSLTSWSVGFQADVYQQNGGTLPTVTVQSTVTGSISSGSLTTTMLTNIVELSYALDSDETRGFLAGLQDTRVAVSGALGQARPSIIGYAGAYYQWPNNWKVTARGGVQSFGGAEFLNTIHLPPLTQPVLRIDLDRLDDDGNRVLGMTAEIMWTPKPTYQFTLRTPLYLVRN
jgi:hypothetical protein